MENELKMIRRRLSYDYPGSLEEEEEELQSSREAFLKITANFLRRMRQEGLADQLQAGGNLLFFPSMLFFCLFEGFSFVQETRPWSVSCNSNPP